jgi:CubicO group peptidase (beta-lactamase class C family)/uncharacterized protein YneR
MNTKKTLLLYLLLLPLFVGAQVPAGDQQAQAIDQYLNEKFKADEPGGSVLVLRNGKTILRKGYGVADLSSKAPITPEMVFRIGSITKQFTSAAILKLSEQGKINLQDDITRYLPDYPTQGKKITIEHLLTHTSGIKSYTSLPALMVKESKAKPHAVQEVINAFKDQPMDFNPGESYLYNNSGFFLLGAIVEKVSGTTWSNYLQKNFFNPLKMKSTFTDDKNISNAVIGYAKNTEYVQADYVHPSLPFAAGAILSTVDDLWKWNEAIFSYKVIKKELLEKAWTPLTLNSGVKQSYGYGWQLAKLDNKKVIAHGGAIDGFLSYALYVPETKIFVTVLCNSMSNPMEEIAYRIAALATGVEEQKEPTAIVVTEKQLDEYTGVYKIKEGDERIVTRDGTQLYFQRSGGSKNLVFAYEADAFFLKASPSKVKFIRGENGAVQKLEINGRDFVNPIGLKTEKPLPKDRIAVKIKPEIFDAYVGQYELTPGFVLTMRREGKNFFSQATGQQSFEIFPESETRFFLKAIDAELEFNKDNTGNVTSVTLFQGGRTVPAKKISGEVPEARTVIQLDPALYDRYTGDYELRPGFILTIKKENEKLMAQATGQPAAEIFPESETKFFYKIVDAQIEFAKDASGNINGLKFYQGINTTNAKKVK